LGASTSTTATCLDTVDRTKNEFLSIVSVAFRRVYCWQVVSLLHLHCNTIQVSNFGEAWEQEKESKS
jgi:hypothetical protein